MMDLDEYSARLGRLFGNFHSLEFALRVFLYGRGDPPHHLFSTGTNLNRLVVGDVVPLNAMTGYDSLGQLIDRYNRLVSPDRPELTVDPGLVNLRDALVHGRVSALSPSSPLTLLKFSKPKKDQAKVSYSAELTDDWFHNQVKLLFAELQKVVKALGNKN